MKIAIFTFVGSRNFGSRLQAFALWRIMSNQGNKVDQIRVINRNALDRIQSGCAAFWRGKIPSLFHRDVRRAKRDFAAAASTRIDYDVADVASDGFPDSIVPVGRGELKKLERVYDAFVCGSDQVWSPLVLPLKKYFYLTFAKRKPKTAYAASFGVSELPRFNRRQFRYISRLDRISVREETGRAIIKRELGRDVPVAVDPVFLLPRETWGEIVGAPPAGEYAFLFFLNRNDGVVSRVEEAMRERGVPVVTMEGERAPEEFVRRISGAKYVFTDSFHALAFSLIFRRDFYCFRRNLPSGIQQESRIVDLLADLSIEGRYFAGADGFVFPSEPIDYDRAEAILNEKIEVSKQFLNESLTE